MFPRVVRQRPFCSKKEFCFFQRLCSLFMLMFVIFFLINYNEKQILITEDITSTSTLDFFSGYFPCEFKHAL
ncbi:hypothetical protein X975_24734, partial [Stegodyphus mimosarum]